MTLTRKRPSLADMVVIAISPALIVVLVTSLVFFLLEILYAGQYATRLQLILFLFVSATVLIARISMEGEIADRSPAYGLALGLATFCALNSLVEYPPGSPLAGFRWLVNLGLMALVWWCAHRLTWDCTFIDEQLDVSGAGLLQLAGLELSSPDCPDSESPIESMPEPGITSRKKSRRNRKFAGLKGWWNQYQAYRNQQRRKPHAPGVWIVYFSLAALPLFGLGQAVIPPSDLERRRYTFWLLAIYVAAGLALLLTTSFIGLRKYLRQRGLRMPAAMTGMWLLLGAALISALLLIGAIIPRPNAEFALLDYTRFTSQKRDASRMSLLRDSPGTKSGSPGSGTGPKTVQNQAQSSGDGEGQQTKSGSKEQNQGERSQSDKNGSPKQSSGQNEGKNAPEQRAASGESQVKGNSGGSKAQNGKQQNREGQSATHGSAGGSNEEASSPTRGLAPPMIRHAWQSLQPLLQKVILAVIAGAGIVLGLRWILRFLANFTNWARGLLRALEGLWQSLFGWWPARGNAAPEPERAAERVASPQPFASFRNPFASGTASAMSNRQLIAYSYRAMEAWAAEQGFARQQHETPLEFGQRLAATLPVIAEVAQQLSSSYAVAAYSSGQLPPGTLENARGFWKRVETLDMTPSGV